MNNQIEAAEKLGLKGIAINSETPDIDEAFENCRQGMYNLIFTTPEQIVKESFRTFLRNIPVAMLVIDEAHCISDWGHDFRLEYMRLREIVSILPTSTALLATTATANNRVVDDLHNQLNIREEDIIRGSLTRDSLSIHRLNIPSKVNRYAWLLDNIPKFSGSGIIYCQTTHDCNMVARFLNENGIDVMPYHSDTNTLTKEQCADAEEKFRNNEIKALVATIKLGMGYDKGDIAFVIHFQQPSNIVSYYQQIGRAGRNIRRAYAVLMCGAEDQRIQNYFINTAFPYEYESRDVYDTIANSPNGASTNEILSVLNYKRGRIEKTLAFLCSEGLLQKDGSRYYITAIPYKYNKEHYEKIINIRRSERDTMNELMTTKECLSRFIVNQLDDYTAQDCKCCQNCLPRPLFTAEVPTEYRDKALAFVSRIHLPIEPRKQWINANVRNEAGTLRVFNKGLCLSKYGDPGIGERVRYCKYNTGRFDDLLVKLSANELKPFITENNVEALTYIPSLRSNMVKDFTERLAAELGMPCVNLLAKTEAPQQKEMNNSYYQCQNAWNSFTVINNVPRSVILVDDMVDSKWTFTVCAHKLKTAGSEIVIPFALADTSNQSEGE